MNWDLGSRSIKMMIEFFALFIILYGLHPLLAWPEGFKTFFIINSTEHEIYQAHKCYNANIYQHDKCNI